MSASISRSYYPIPEGIPLKTEKSILEIDPPCKSMPPFGPKEVEIQLEQKKSDHSLQYRPLTVDKGKVGDNSPGWKKVRDSGQIRMTPYHVFDNKIVEHLGQVLRKRHVANFNSYGWPENSQCVRCADHDNWQYERLHLYGEFIEQGNLAYWRDKYPDAPHFSDNTEWHQGEIESAKASAYAELFKAYDLGEELYELRETIATAASLLRRGASILEQAKKAYEQFRRKDPSGALNSWMEYRYAIMPVVYSLQDIIKVSNEKGLYRTIRKTVKPKAHKDISSTWHAETHFWDEVVDNSTVSITAKGRWPSLSLKQFDLVNLNPITTFARVYKLAFVVRWFLNVNEWLEAQIKSWTTLAHEYNACVATRTNRSILTYAHIVDRSSQISFPDWDGYSACGAGWYSYPDKGKLVTYGDVEIYDILLQEVTVNEYVRKVFLPSDTKLAFRLRVNWRNLIDAIALLLGPSKQALRRLQQ